MRTTDMAVLFLMILSAVFNVDELSKDHRGTEFVLAFIPNNPMTDSHILYIVSEEVCKVMLTGDHGSYSKIISLSPLIPHNEDLAETWKYTGGLDMSVERKALHIIATRNITVFASYDNNQSVDGFLAIPVEHLTRNYVAVSRDAVPDPSHLVIAGLYDGTNAIINLRLLNGTCTTAGYQNGTTISLTVNRFDVIGLSCSGDLTGTVITSYHPVAVFSGNERAAVPTTSPNAGLMIEMLIPLEYFGKSYVLTTTMQNPNGTIYRVVAHMDNSVVTVGSQDPVVLGVGEFHDFDTEVTGTQILMSTHTVMVIAYGKVVVGNLGGVFMATVPPINSFYKRPFYDFRKLVVVPMTYLYVTVCYNTTMNPNITFGSPDVIEHIPGSDIGVLSALTTDLEGSSFETDVHDVGMIIYANPSKNAACGYLGGMTFRQDPCSSGPCLNDAACVSTGASFTCHCPVGFTGVLCETADDPCGAEPCYNNATCSSIGTLFICVCPSGYTGITCQSEINECDSIPCLNGGICTDLVAGYHCECVAGYTGLRCGAGTELATSFHPSSSESLLSALTSVPNLMTSDAGYQAKSADVQIQSSQEPDISQETIQVTQTLTPMLQTSLNKQEFPYAFTRITIIGDSKHTESGLTILKSALEATMYTTTYASHLASDMSCDYEGTSQGEYQCMCTRYERKVYVVTEEAKESIKEDTQRRLLVETANLTKTLLKYKSVEDNRPSAKGIGSVGVIMLVMTAAVIVVPDMLFLVQNVMRKCTGKKTYSKC